MLNWKEIINIKLNTKKDKKYINNICSFDIETTNYITENIKQGFMYIWMFGIDDTVYYGRTWYEFKQFINIINDKLNNKRMMVYVHNLSFEFQFLRNVFEFENVFARKKREVLCCSIKEKNIDFKCSYALSNLSLDNVAKIYKLNTMKMSGDLDYTKIRTSKTELTNKELKYCENDCLVVNEFIKIMLEKYKSFDKIPLTSTGIVRRDFKNYIKENYRENKKYSIKNWKEFVSKKQNRYKTFTMLCKCFCGGYVHANEYYRNKIIKKVSYYDFTSSYPSVMITEKFPVCDFYRTSESLDELDYENKCYILDLRFKNIICKTLSPSISAHKAENEELIHFKMNNGRITSADNLRITCTEQDYLIIKNNYDFESVEIVELLSARKAYLPKVFIEFIIKTYLKKQELKQFKDEKSAEYQLAKEQLNSLYGMCITNYIRDNINYKNDWDESSITEKDIEKILNQTKEQQIALLPYSWGVWISAYARKNIFDIINGVGDDYIYTDTDSIAFINNHNDVIRKYNKKIEEKLKLSLMENEINMFDELKGIGEMSECEKIEEMKTLGAKRYAYVKNKKLILKISGVGKDAIKEIKTLNDFNENTEISKENSGHKIKYYNDKQIQININDEIINDEYGICIENSSFSFNGEVEVNKKYGNSKILKNF